MPKALLVGGPWDGDTYWRAGGQFLELRQPILVDGHYQVREVVYQYVGVDDPESDEPLLVYEWIYTTPPHPYGIVKGTSWVTGQQWSARR